MTKKTTKAVSVIAALAVTLSLSSCFGSKGGEESGLGDDELKITPDSISEKAEQPQAPDVTDAPGTEAQKPVETEPAQTEETMIPVQPDVPQSAETEAPAPQTTGVKLADTYSGSFRSDTGLGVEIIADWMAEQVGIELYLVTVSVRLESYSISVSARDNNYIRLGDTKLAYSTDAIEIESDDGISEKPLNTLSFRITASELANGMELEAVWNFNGTYSDVYTGAITASGMVIA